MSAIFVIPKYQRIYENDSPYLFIYIYKVHVHSLQLCLVVVGSRVFLIHMSLPFNFLVVAFYKNSIFVDENENGSGDERVTPTT